MSYLIRLNGHEHAEHQALPDAVIAYTLLVGRPSTMTAGLYGPRRLPPFKREVIAEYVRHLEQQEVAPAPDARKVETSTNQSVSTRAQVNSEGEAYGVTLSVREGRRETSVMLTRGEARHVAQDLLSATQQHL